MPCIAIRVMESLSCNTSGLPEDRRGMYCLTCKCRTSSWFVAVVPGYSRIWLAGTTCSLISKYSVCDIVRLVSKTVLCPFPSGRAN